MAGGVEEVCPACLGILQSLGAGQVGKGTDDALLRSSDGQSGDSVPDGPLAVNTDGREKKGASVQKGAVSKSAEANAAAGDEVGPGSSLCDVIKARVQQSGQQLKDCALEVSTPALLFVRQHALWLGPRTASRLYLTQISSQSRNELYCKMV